jgi:hypothetical protein
MNLEKVHFVGLYCTRTIILQRAVQKTLQWNQQSRNFILRILQAVNSNNDSLPAPSARTQLHHAAVLVAQRHCLRYSIPPDLQFHTWLL